jgi:RimJ/RimL family protein N-acetyltransferase
MTAIVVPDGLSGPLVKLRALEELDAAAYAAAYLEDSELGRLQGYESDPDEDRARQKVSRSHEAAERGEGIELAICDAATGDFVGVISLLEVDRQRGRCELAYWLIPRARGNGLVDAAIILVLDWVFVELDLLRVEIATTAENHRSQDVARRHGFAREALQRQRDIERGRRVDVIQFGLLREEHVGLRS